MSATNDECVTKFYNRELSWLQFNERVLQEARDTANPLMQRLRFLGIFSNNQDEFIKVRVANIIRMDKSRKKGKKLTGGFTPSELLTRINLKVWQLQEFFMDTYNKVLGELARERVRILTETRLSPEQEEFCRDYFASVVSQRIVPLIIRKSVKIPFLPDGQIYLAVRMETGKSTQPYRYSVIRIPVSEACPRFVVLPKGADGSTDVIFLDDIIRLCLNDIFFMFGYEQITAYTFKIIRDAELSIDDDMSKSFVEKMETGITKRHHGLPIRLVYDKDMPADLLNTIASKLGLRLKQTLNPGGRYHMMSDLMDFPRIRPDLESRKPKPMRHPAIVPFTSILKIMRQQDILLNFPYHTFEHVIDFLREVAIDPRVESICITLYRTAEHSKVINALVNAAKNGKKVTVLMELKARFDEEKNIRDSETLQAENIRVVHSPEDLKVHSKLILVERREGSNPRKGYVYVGTGNFNETTARLYSDFGLLTCDAEIVEDAVKVFDIIDNPYRQHNFRKLLVSPFHMRNEITGMIEREIHNVKKGRPAYIHAKFNSLTDEKMILLLHRAAHAGVHVRLIVRGACSLRPPAGGNIEIISIVDALLEHARFMIFCNGGDEKVYISSADIMTRNLDRRIEIAAPILQPEPRQTLREVFDIEWSDNTKARMLTPSDKRMYVRRDTDGQEPVRSQTALYTYYNEKKLLE